MSGSANEGFTTTLRPAERAGEALVGRDAAADLRREIVQRLGRGEQVVLDFSGVSVLSPSFADELLAKLPPEVLDNGEVIVEHLSRGQQALAHMVVAGRTGQSPAWSQG